MPWWENWRYDLAINSVANVIVAAALYVVARWAGVVPKVGRIDVVVSVVGGFMAFGLAIWAIAEREPHDRWGSFKSRTFASISTLVLLGAGYMGRGDPVMVGLTCGGFVVVVVWEVARLERRRLAEIRAIAESAARRRSGLARHRPVRLRTPGPRPRSLRR
ncbi:hypothetical protein [Kineosporia succinea]|uniref:Low temperature requirement A protein (LtrA) n=1 Tax=Kineosporia succinea TaxID=84632 RepID=A0ABT9NZ21_9ACTN|nr:hypothetical protein [Kineosporia succinea]MDP9825210.1 hypothetical protein [Kineosporia succinea]